MYGKTHLHTQIVPQKTPVCTLGQRLLTSAVNPLSGFIPKCDRLLARQCHAAPFRRPSSKTASAMMMNTLRTFGTSVSGLPRRKAANCSPLFHQTGKENHLLRRVLLLFSHFAAPSALRAGGFFPFLFSTSQLLGHSSLSLIPVLNDQIPPISFRPYTGFHLLYASSLAVSRYPWPSDLPQQPPALTCH